MGSATKRPWVLQFFRNLFGSSRHDTQERQQPKAEAKEKEEVGSQLLDCPLGLSDTDATLPPDKELGATEIYPSEIHESVTESRTEELSLLKESSFQKAAPRKKQQLCDLLNSAEMEMGRSSDGFPDSMRSQLVEHPCERAQASGEKKNETGDRETLGKDEVSQVLQADDGVSMAVGSMVDVKDCSAEEEKEHLLKEDVPTEPPKAELSPWNRLIKMYKQRRRLPSSKVTHLQDIPAQPVTKDDTTLDLTIYGIATPKAHVTVSNSSGADCAYGLPENEGGEIAGDYEITKRLGIK